MHLSIQRKVIATPTSDLTPVQTIVFNYIKQRYPVAIPLEEISKRTQAQLQKLSTSENPNRVVSSAIQVLKIREKVVDQVPKAGSKGLYRFNLQENIIEHVSIFTQANPPKSIQTIVFEFIQSQYPSEVSIDTIMDGTKDQISPCKNLRKSVTSAIQGLKNMGKSKI